MPRIEITAVGGMIRPVNDDRYRPKARGDQVDVSEADAARYIANGTAVLVDDRVAADAEDEQPDGGVFDLDAMTIPELRKFADARRMKGIGSLRTRPEIVAAIEDQLTAPESEDD